VDQLHPNEAALAVRETCPSIVLVLLQSSIIMLPRKNVWKTARSPPGEKFAVDSVAIVDDVAWCPFPAAGFDELSGHPLALGCAVASHKATETRVSEQLGL
jgi:hypothetical protein